MFLTKQAQQVIFSLLVILALGGAWAQTPPPDEGDDPSIPTFRLQAVEQKFLPPEMYGTWAINATVLRTDAPSWMFQPESQEIWSFARDGNVITLQNLLTSAWAEITVDDVHGNTATFHHEATAPNNRTTIIETPTITVVGDRLFGMNVQAVTVHPSLGRPHTYTLEIKVEGTRLSGARVRFDGYGRPEPNFVVEPLRQETR